MDEFTKAYIEAALWSESDDDGNPLSVKYFLHDIDVKTLQEMIVDCEFFIKENWNYIKSNLSQAGHDFLLTRNHHGAGFWDGEWPEGAEDKLTKSAHSYGEFNLYIGDDGKIYGT